MQIVQTWALTSDLTVPRANHTATALLDGRVLVTGGADPGSGTTYDSAELYHPGANNWTATGSMLFPRTGHTATLLPDGKVLVVGGTMDTMTELYDPVTGVWSAAGRLTAPRPFGHDTTLLADGRVLVAGGFNGTLPVPMCFLSAAEIYDPNTQVWTRTGDMNAGRYTLTLTGLLDGTALVAGGGNPGGLHTAELWDPATATWSYTGDLVELVSGRFEHTATLLDDGRVLVAGGLTTVDMHLESLDTTEVYDAETHSWFPVGTLQMARRSHTATRLHDGRVVVVGGVEHDSLSGGYLELKSAEVFDPATFEWTQIPDLNEARVGHAQATVHQRYRIIENPFDRSSLVLVAGGGDIANTAERYEFVWQPIIEE
jgi:hypothetical protein